VTMGFRDLVVAALQMDEVISEAQNLASSVLNQVLQDPEVVAEARRTLNETLQDSELRATAKETLWGVVLPWGNRAAPTAIPKAIKSIDELSSLDALTPEEKQMLKSLQARIKAQPSSSPVVQVPGVSSSTESAVAPEIPTSSSTTLVSGVSETTSEKDVSVSSAKAVEQTSDSLDGLPLNVQKSPAHDAPESESRNNPDWKIPA